MSKTYDPKNLSSSAKDKVKQRENKKRKRPAQSGKPGKENWKEKIETFSHTLHLIVLESLLFVLLVLDIAIYIKWRIFPDY